MRKLNVFTLLAALIAAILILPIACGEREEPIPPPADTSITTPPPPVGDTSPNGGTYGQLSAALPNDSQFCTGDVVLQLEGAAGPEYMVVHPDQAKIGMPGLSIHHRIEGAPPCGG